MKNDYLAISWGVSRGRDTYGYNICRGDSLHTGIRYRTMGCGYDMIGTVLGDYLQDAIQPELQALVTDRCADLVDCGYSVAGYLKLPELYGLTVCKSGAASIVVTLDGVCGRDAMIRIAEACGYDVTSTCNRKGHVIGYFISKRDGGDV